jgi:hypothetical protein
LPVFFGTPAESVFKLNVRCLAPATPKRSSAKAGPGFQGGTGILPVFFGTPAESVFKFDVNACSRRKSELRVER